MKIENEIKLKRNPARMSQITIGEREAGCDECIIEISNRDVDSHSVLISRELHELQSNKKDKENKRELFVAKTNGRYIVAPSLEYKMRTRMTIHKEMAGRKISIVPFSKYLDVSLTFHNKKTGYAIKYSLINMYGV